VAADDQPHIRPVESLERSQACRWDDAGSSCHIVVGIIQKEGLVQEQRNGPLSGGRQLLVEPNVGFVSRARPEPKSWALTPMRRQAFRIE
jgi:hypothetical protein